MNNRILISSTVALMSLLLASAAFAQGRGHRGHHRGAGMGQRMAAELELTDEQRAAIRELRREAREAAAPAREDMQALRTQLGELWAAEQPDADAILSTQGQMDALRGVIRQERQQLRTEIQGLLTAEQRARATELRGERPRRGQGRHAARAGRGGGMGQRMAERLDLSDEQQQQIQALRRAARAATSEARSQLRELRQMVREQREAGSPDAALLEEAQAQMDTLRQSIREQRVDTRIAVLELLTAEQREALQELQEQRQQRRGRRGPARGR